MRVLLGILFVLATASVIKAQFFSQSTNVQPKERSLIISYQELEGVTFEIQPKFSERVLDIEGGSKVIANCILFGRHGGANQKFRLIRAQGQWFFIQSVNSGLVLDVSSGSTQDLLPIIQYPLHGGLNQQFRIVKSPFPGYFHIQSHHSFQYLDVKEGLDADLAQLIHYTPHAGENQSFRFIIKED